MTTRRKKRGGVELVCVPCMDGDHGKCRRAWAFQPSEDRANVPYTCICTYCYPTKAQLSAAGLDLLAALELALPFMDAPSKGRGMFAERSREVRAQMLVAIAKARGGETK